jgi:glutamate 5-kinase
MRTKIEAARIATAAGIRTVIAQGRRERVLAAVLAGETVGTTFLPRPDSDRLPARKRWIAHSARPRGAVTVNARAREKLETSGVSLLAVGIVEVTGAFSSGDLIEVRDESGQVFARGLTNYAAGEIRRVQGLRSEQFEATLGYRGFEEIIHRDNLVVECRPPS